MDRTSILGDTIDYMKELLERIKRLQEETEVDSSDHQANNLLGIFKDLSPNEVLVRNSPKVVWNLVGMLSFSFLVRLLIWPMSLLLIMAHVVWSGEERWRHEDRDLLRREAWAAAFHDQHSGGHGAWDSAVCCELLQWFWNAGFLLWGEGEQINSID